MEDYQEMRRRAGEAEFDTKRLRRHIVYLLMLQFGFNIQEAEQINKDENLMEFFLAHIERNALSGIKQANRSTER